MPPQPELPELPTVAPEARRTIASYASYAEAESAVEWLVQHGFPIQRGAIVGTGLRSVEQLSGVMSARRAALLGFGPGILVGALFALLAGAFPWDSGSAEVLLYAVGVSALLGSVSGALLHEALSGGRRDFVSSTRLEAERYDVQVDEDSAHEATRLLGAMPGTSGVTVADLALADKVDRAIEQHAPDGTVQDAGGRALSEREP